MKLRLFRIFHLMGFQKAPISVDAKCKGRGKDRGETCNNKGNSQG